MLIKQGRPVIVFGTSKIKEEGRHFSKNQCFIT